MCKIMQKVWDGFQQNLVEDQEWASEVPVKFGRESGKSADPGILITFLRQWTFFSMNNA